MTHTEEATVTRAVSRDGTEIAYWTSGDGPPLLLVHGATADHTRWAPVLPYLEPYVTVHAMDRRGRGRSGDAPEYRIEREWEDIAAVVDAVAAAYGSPVDLLGHSYGGLCAYGAATLTGNIRKLMLYEGWPPPNPAAVALPADIEARISVQLATGDREGALETMFRDFVGMPEADFAAYRALPVWRVRIAAAHTLLRECRAEAVTPFDPEQAKRITAPVLLLVGGDSPDSVQAGYPIVAAGLPDARVVVIEGQQHIAMDLVPEVFARHLLGFLRAD